MNKKRKDENRFRDFQEKNQNDRVAIIELCLEELANKRSRYQYITDLAKDVSEYLSNEQKKPCSTSTLLRNRKYKAMLTSFFADQELTLVKRKKINDAESHEITSVNQEIEKLITKNENLRLKKYIDHLLAASGEIVREDKKNNEGDRLRILERDFADVCQMTWTLLNRLNEIIALDVDANQIIDKSVLVNRVICGPTITTPFFNWLRQLPPQVVHNTTLQGKYS